MPLTWEPKFERGRQVGDYNQRYGKLGSLLDRSRVGSGIVIEIWTDTGDFARVMKLVPKYVRQDVVKVMRRRVAPLVKRVMRKRMSASPTGGNGYLGARTGKTRNSLRVEVADTNMVRTHLLVTIKGPGAVINEDGGTVTAPPGGWLYIPISGGPAITSTRKIQRRWPSQLITDIASFGRGITGWYIAGRTVLGTRKRGAPIPIFARRKQITLKPIGYVKAGYREFTPKVRDLVAQAIAAGLRSGLNVRQRKLKKLGGAGVAAGGQVSRFPDFGQDIG